MRSVWDTGRARVSVRGWGFVVRAGPGGWRAVVLPPDAQLTGAVAWERYLAWRHGRLRPLLAWLMCVLFVAAALWLAIAAVAPIVVSAPATVLALSAPWIAAALIDHRRRPGEIHGAAREVTVRSRPTERVHGRPSAWSPPDRPDIVDFVIALDRLFVLVGEDIVSEGEWQAAHKSAWDFLGRSVDARDVLGYDRITARLAHLAELALDRYDDAAGRADTPAAGGDRPPAAVAEELLLERIWEQS